MNLILLSNLPLNVPDDHSHFGTALIVRIPPGASTAVLSAGTQVCVHSDAYHDTQPFVWLSVPNHVYPVKCEKSQLKPAYPEL